MKLQTPITEKDLADLEEYKKSYVYTNEIVEPTTTKEFFIGVYTLVVEEVKRNVRVWVQNIFAPFINAIMYFLVFGFVLGSKIGEIHGVSYIDFLIPGFLVIPTITAAFGNGAFSSFTRIFFKVIEAIQMSPLSAHTFLVGTMIAAILRSLTISVLIWIAGVLFSGNVFLYNLPLIIFLIVIVGAIFALIGVINGIYAKSFEEISFFPTFVLTPLLYVSGTFFDTQSLPWFFAKLSLLNPLNHIVNAYRYAFIGFESSGIYFSVVALLVLLVVLYFVTIKLVKEKLNLNS